jgi:hypothetical protein
MYVTLPGQAYPSHLASPASIRIHYAPPNRSTAETRFENVVVMNTRSAHIHQLLSQFCLNDALDGQW